MGKFKIFPIHKKNSVIVYGNRGEFSYMNHCPYCGGEVKEINCYIDDCGNVEENDYSCEKCGIVGRFMYGHTEIVHNIFYRTYKRFVRWLKQNMKDLLGKSPKQMTDEDFINSLPTKPEIKAQQTMVIIKHPCGCTITLSGGGRGRKGINNLWCKVCGKHKQERKNE